MKRTALTTTLLIMFTCLQSAWAYSPIWNVDGWDTARLAEAGISVASWRHDQIGEDPPLNWVKITYDSSKLQKDHNVLMTLCVTSSNGKTACNCRAERLKEGPLKLSILFAVPQKKNIDTSSVEILVPGLMANAAQREYGNPGFGGYRLSLDRIITLAGKTSANKTIDRDNK
jgi:hypothetical protein